MTTCVAEAVSIDSMSLSELSSSSSVSDKFCANWGRACLLSVFPVSFRTAVFKPYALSLFTCFFSCAVANLPGCELRAAQTTAVFEVEDDLLENQFFVKTICLSAEAGDEMHVVAVSDGVGGSKPIPIATLRHCMPMVSFPGLELLPPVTFQLCSGKGPVFISGQHITLNPTEIPEEEEEGGLEEGVLTE